MDPKIEKGAVTRWGRVKLPDDKVLEVFRLRLAGKGLRAIAGRLKLHWMYVQQVVKGEARADAHPDHPLRAACVAAELKKREAFRQKCSRLRAPGGPYDRAVTDYRRGYSLRAAAARHGVSFGRLCRVLDRRGIARRPVGKPSKFCHYSKGVSGG